MVELPEVVTIARQMNEELKGCKIEECTCGNSPHKWVFYNRPREEFERVVPGRKVGPVTGDGKMVSMALRPGYTLQIGDMGGRIQLHRDEAALPTKYHFLLRFDDGSRLTVAVQGWGFVRLFDHKERRKQARKAKGRLSPLSDAFTEARFRQLLAEDEGRDTKSVKAFLTQRPRIDGIGNGYLQDILFRAGIHPTRKIRDLRAREQRRLYRAICRTLQQAIKLGGRDDEHNLYGETGRYTRTLSAKAKGRPCPKCGTKIEKIQYLGGACYFCPRCQA